MLKVCFYQRLAISLVLAFSLLLGLFLWLSNHSQQNMHKLAEQTLHLNLAQHLVADNPLLSQGVTDYDALENLFHTQMVLGPSFEFYFLSPTGALLTYSGDMADVHTMQIDLAPIEQLLDEPESLPIYGVDPKGLDRNKIFSVAPVHNEQGLQGYLYIIIGGVHYDNVWQGLSENQFMRSLLLAGVAAIVFLLFALLLLFRYFTLPLKKLSVDMQSVVRHNFDLTHLDHDKQHWRGESHNEVQQLGASFNAMLMHIDRQMQALKQETDNRKSLLTDIAHDLRTPLANLQGYIETLSIQQDQLSPQQQREFINISLKNMRNLKHLIDQIFELAYLESGHVQVQTELFSLGELMHDIMAKFAIKAEQHKLNLSIDMDEEDVFIHSDIAKLERVLTNLIENAIRHTPEGGTISLKAVDEQEQVIIIVSDTGVGIAASDIACIFKARYQGTNTCNDGQKHIGLGLAICQELTQTLGGEITVTSELGKGTAFCISVPGG